MAPPLTAGRWARLASTESATTRERSASDLALAIFTLVPTLLLGLIAVPESGFERALAALVAAVPGALDVLWRFGLAGLGLWACSMLAAAVLLRRWWVLAEIALSAAIGVGMAVLTSHRVNGGWPSVDQLATGGAGGAIPLALLVVASSASSAAGPYLARPVRTTGRWSASVGAVCAVLVGATTPVGGLISVLLGVGAAALAHLALGTSAGRPTAGETATALRSLGLEVAELATSPRQSSGVVAMEGLDADGERVRIKVYGRDARDTQLLNAIWRRIWYSNDASLSGSRERQVEHEAFIMLLAANFGVAVPAVAVAGLTQHGDAAIAVRGAGRPLSEVDSLDPADTVAQLWSLVHRLHDANIVHNELNADAFGAGGGRVVLREMATATMSTGDEGRTTDVAQLTCITATLLGVEAAVEVAADELGPAAVEAMLPYLQRPALGRELRRSVKDADIELGDLRTALAARAGVEPPATAKLRRVSPKSLATVGLVALVAFSLLSTFGNIDLAELADLISGMSPGWALGALCVAQLVFISQAVAVSAAAPKRVSLGPLALLQASVAFVALAVPSTAGRLAMNVRFFQRQGMTAPTALSVGAVDGFSGFLVQVSVLLLTLGVGVGQVNLTFDVSPDSNLGWIPAALAVLAAFTASAAVVAVAVPRLRSRIGDRVGPMLAEARSTVSSLRSPGNLARLFGGNFASELILAATLGLSLHAFGSGANLATLLVISVGAALFGGLMPVPGGIGVTEAALATGLVAAGIESSTATATALLYRATTYYLPPVWGLLAMRWLQRHSYL
ncbi:MAG: lysylphosphatidylglycerol synthase transmembrane domain-containing protein [Microthrixaceae bacterium]